MSTIRQLTVEMLRDVALKRGDPWQPLTPIGVLGSNARRSDLDRLLAMLRDDPGIYFDAVGDGYIPLSDEEVEARKRIWDELARGDIVAVGELNGIAIVTWKKGKSLAARDGSGTVHQLRLDGLLQTGVRKEEWLRTPWEDVDDACRALEEAARGVPVDLVKVHVDSRGKPVSVAEIARAPIIGSVYHARPTDSRHEVTAVAVAIALLRDGDTLFQRHGNVWQPRDLTKLTGQSGKAYRQHAELVRARPGTIVLRHRRVGTLTGRTASLSVQVAVTPDGDSAGPIHEWWPSAETKLVSARTRLIPENRVDAPR